MALLKPGDRVCLKLLGGNVVEPHQFEYDEITTLEVIAVDYGSFYLFTPSYKFILGTIKITRSLCKQLNLDLKFVDERCIIVKDTMIYKISSVRDGLFCGNCNLFCEYAAPNQPDNSFICYSCRQNPYRK